MLYEDEMFKIYYNSCDERYLKKLIDIVLERMPKILQFFDIELKGKITIKLYAHFPKIIDKLNKTK